MGKVDDNISYYKINYENDSREIDANLNSIVLTKQFLVENNISYSIEKFSTNYFDKLGLIERIIKKEI